MYKTEYLKGIPLSFFQSKNVTFHQKKKLIL